MTASELVAQVKLAGGKQLADVPDNKAKALVRLVFAEINKQIEAGNGEAVRVPGFGVFKSSTVDREKDGQKTTVKRTVFRASQPK